MKKILIIGLTERLGGVETFIYNTTKFSNKEKYEYFYLVHGANTCVFKKEINNFYNNENHIFYVNSIKKRPIKTFFQLVTFYKNHKFDIIHLQTGSCAEIMYVFPFILFMNSMLITHSHNGNGNNLFINSVFRTIVNFVTKKRLACSQKASKWLFGAKKRSIIINNGIDSELFTFNNEARQEKRKEFNIPDDTIVIGHVGRFSDQKNHKFIVDIFKKYNNKNPNSILMLVGDGYLIKTIKSYVNKSYIKNKVIFVGERSDMNKLYCCFDIFVMPSLYEGLPIVGIEAQSTGLNCVFSNMIDKQILISNRAKMIGLEKNAEYWADEMLKIKNLGSRNKYSGIIGEKGYSIKATIEQLENVYEV